MRLLLLVVKVSVTVEDWKVTDDMRLPPVILSPLPTTYISTGGE